MVGSRRGEDKNRDVLKTLISFKNCKQARPIAGDRETLAVYPGDLANLLLTRPVTVTVTL
jgi:hypothetical protein